MIALLALVVAQATPASPPPERKRQVTFRYAFDRNFFNKGDTNGDGRLELAEFQAALLPRFEAEVAARTADAPEAWAKYEREGRDKVMSMFAAQYRSFDVNSDGRLLWEEMESVLKGRPSATR